MNILKRIQNLVMSVDSFDFGSYDLTDGKKVETDTETLEIGSIISLVTDAGKELAPAGPHTLADGRTIVLDESSKVTEIKEKDAPTAAEEDMKMPEKMAMEMDPELVSAVSEIIKKKATGLSEDDLTSLSNELIMAIVAYDELSDNEAEAEDSTPMVVDMSEKFNELSAIVLELAKAQEKFSSEIETKLSKVPTGKAISEMEFSSEPEVIDPLAARIEAIKNLNK
jgi:hypothetical protein